MSGIGNAFRPFGKEYDAHTPAVCCESCANLTRNLTASQSALTKARGQVAEAVTFLRDMSCDGCEYGDDCPSTGTNHYVCRACQCSRAADRLEGKAGA